MLNITMEQAIVKKRKGFLEVGVSTGSTTLAFMSLRFLSLSKGRPLAINHITHSDKQDAIIVKNLTPKLPEKKMLLKKVINPTIGGWSK
jgi:hypothetical protein